MATLVSLIPSMLAQPGGIKGQLISQQMWLLPFRHLPQSLERTLTSVTDALSTMLRLLGEESQEASWLIQVRSRMDLVEPCNEE